MRGFKIRTEQTVSWNQFVKQVLKASEKESRSWVRLNSNMQSDLNKYSRQILCHMHTALLVSRWIQELGNRLYWVGTQASQHKCPNRQLFTINRKIFDTCFSSIARSHLKIPAQIHNRDKRLPRKGHSSSLFSGWIHTTATHTSDYNSPLTPLTWQRQDRLHSHYTFCFCCSSPQAASPCTFPANQLSSGWAEQETELVRVCIYIYVYMVCKIPVISSMYQLIAHMKSQLGIQMPAV